MKINTYIRCLVILILMVACKQKEEVTLENVNFEAYFNNKDNIPVVKGKVFNLTTEEINNTQLEYAIVSPFAGDQLQINKVGKLNPDGTFELEIDYALPNQQIWLSIGELFYAGIYANSDLFIEVDSNGLKEERLAWNGPQIKYLGADGEMNTFLNNHMLFKRDEQLSLGRAIQELGNNWNLDHETYLSKHDSIYKLLHTIDDEFLEKNPSPYAALIKNERLSDYYGEICVKYWAPDRPKMDENLFNDIISHTPRLVSNSGSLYYNYLVAYLEINFGNSHKVNWGDFSQYSQLSSSDKYNIDEYTKIKAIKENGKPYDTLKLKELSTDVYTALKDTLTIFKTSRTTKILDSLFKDSKADLLKLQLSSKDPKEKKIILETILPSVNTKWCYDILNSNYEKSMEQLATIEGVLKAEKEFVSASNLGEPLVELPFGAKLYNVDNVSGEELLANIKSAFYGKALVMDFWATWCVPCLEDMPYSKKLHDAFESSPIEFVYLCSSSGSDMDKWKAQIIKMELGGTHLFVESSIENELMKLFSFGGFPSYAFIDLQGNYKAGAIQRMSFLENEDLKKLIDGQ